MLPRMGEAPLVRVAVHHPLEGALQPGAPLAGTLDFRAGREAAAGGAAPRCTEVRLLHLCRGLWMQLLRLFSCRSPGVAAGRVSCGVRSMSRCPLPASAVHGLRSRGGAPVPYIFGSLLNLTLHVRLPSRCWCCWRQRRRSQRRGSRRRAPAPASSARCSRSVFRFRVLP